MRVVEPHQFEGVKHPKQKRKRLTFGRLLVVGIISVYALSVFARPVPQITFASAALPGTETKKPVIAWPSYGQAAIGAVGYGILGTNGEQKPLPTASVAKVMTALAVLKQKPLRPGEQGPTITITEADVAEYARTVAQDGSNVPVVVGEEITEYQALQALLLPSANNMAYTLARWAYGSDDKYLAFVNNFSKSLGMKNTYFDDASGFSSKTASTAEDLVKLAVNAMDNPVIAEIAAQEVATIPVAGQIYNVNMLLGRNGIVGVKTGNTEEAGGCFMAAAVREINGQKIIAVSVIMGAPNLYTALKDSVPLITSVLSGFETKTVVKAGQVVGTYNVPWNGQVNVLAKQAISGVAWSDSIVMPITNTNNISAATTAQTQVGMVSASFGRQKIESPVVLSQNIAEPSWSWRLKPRLDF
jgi:D-alanyl-D-alanine carboxypeptidase (penicillin-binding protein 5/6)